MEKIKSNWKFVVYWFVVMSVINVYVIPKYVDNEAITTKRVVVGLTISLLSGLVMALLSPTPKRKQD